MDVEMGESEAGPSQSQGLVRAERPAAPQQNGRIPLAPLDEGKSTRAPAASGSVALFYGGPESAEGASLSESHSSRANSPNSSANVDASDTMPACSFMGRWRLRDMSISEDEANVSRSWSSSTVGSPRSPSSSMEDSPKWQSSPAATASLYPPDTATNLNGHSSTLHGSSYLRYRDANDTSPPQRPPSQRSGNSLASDSVPHDEGLLDSFSLLATRQNALMTGATLPAKQSLSREARPASQFPDIVPRNSSSFGTGQRLLDSTRHKNMWRSAMVERKMPLLGLANESVQPGQTLPAINRIVQDEVSFSAAECHGEREMHQKFRLSRSCNDLCFPSSSASDGPSGSVERPEKDSLAFMLTSSMQIDSTAVISEKSLSATDAQDNSPSAMSDCGENSNGATKSPDQAKTSGSPAALSMPADSPEPAMSPVGFFTTPGSPGAAGAPLGMRPRSGSQSPYRRSYTSPGTLHLRQSVLNAKRKHAEMDESMEDLPKRPCKGDRD